MAFTGKDIEVARASRAAREASESRRESVFRYCPRCNAMVDDLATFCHACGVALSEEVATQPELVSSPFTRLTPDEIYQEEKARIKARQQIEAKQKAQGCLVFLVIVFGFWLYAQIPNGTATPTKPAPTPAELVQQKIDQARREVESKAAHEKSECEDGGMQAYFNSQDFVERQLKTPATAEFPWFWNIHTHYLGQCRHEVNAYVDSQNIFGAKVRTRYIATLRYAGNDKWTLEDLKFSQ